MWCEPPIRSPTSTRAGRWWPRSASCCSSIVLSAPEIMGPGISLVLSAGPSIGLVESPKPRSNTEAALITLGTADLLMPCWRTYQSVVFDAGSLASHAAPGQWSHTLARIRLSTSSNVSPRSAQ